MSDDPRRTATFPDSVSVQMLETEAACLRSRLDACEPYLKDGEWPHQCIERNRADVDIALGLLAKEKDRSDGLRTILRAIRRDGSADWWHRRIDEALARYHRSGKHETQADGAA